jgi:hypothetical protein
MAFKGLKYLVVLCLLSLHVSDAYAGNARALTSKNRKSKVITAPSFKKSSLQKPQKKSPKKVSSIASKSASLKPVVVAKKIVTSGSQRSRLNNQSLMLPIQKKTDHLQTGSFLPYGALDIRSLEDLQQESGSVYKKLDNGSKAYLTID